MVYLKVGKYVVQNIGERLPSVGALVDRGGPRAPT